MSSRCLVVVGAQWGDEGKGKIVDVLAAEAAVIARYQGGANAGHTVHAGGDEFILHQIPSGILHPGTRCLLGNGVVLDLEQFFIELDGIEARNIDTEGRLGISGRAHLLLDYHKKLDQASERNRGEQKIGTTGRGIGPAYEDKIARMGVRVADLMNPDRARDLLRAGTERANEKLRQAGAEPLDPASVIDGVFSVADRLIPLIAETGREITQALKADRKVLLEGAQGSLLDVDHGTYPFVTSSTTTAGGAATGVGIGPTMIGEVLGVVKAYTTRVGRGPLPTEIPPPLGDQLRELGGEYGATTGRPRRCGWFDAVVVRYSVRVNGFDSLALTKLDVLDELAEIPVCTSYRFEGDALQELPSDIEVLEKCEPVYETLPGWQSQTKGMRSHASLPTNAQRYVARLAELSGCEVGLISTSPDRHDTIVRGKSAIASWFE